jgi:NADPH:quinone reductase-like Zn-dependent oxidoreductase
MSKVPVIASTGRAWQYNGNSGTLEPRLFLSPTAPTPTPKPDQHLVKIHYVGLNPVDHKGADTWFISRFFITKPATPGIDFSGTILQPAPGSGLKVGQKVLGAAGTNHFAGGALRDLAIATIPGTYPMPENAPFSMEEAATVGVAGLTAYQSIVPYVKKGDRILILGGSGGTGVFGLQIAKHCIGCHVTTTCSTRNVELVKSLGADEVIDYKTQDLLSVLQAKAKGGEGYYDHIVDNVGDLSLFPHAHEFSKKNAGWVYVGAAPTLKGLMDSLRFSLFPSFLGGGKRKFIGFFAQPKQEHVKQLTEWMVEGKVKTLIDSRWKFEEAPKAFEKLRTQRTRGKIVVKVAGEGEEGEAA